MAGRGHAAADPIQELRDLTRTRRELTRAIVRHTQRFQATLKEANIKLAWVILRIPTKPAGHSDTKPTPDSDVTPAGVPI